jgi:hypothetical protein
MRALLILANLLLAAAALPSQARADNGEARGCCQYSVHGYGHCCINCTTICMFDPSAKDCNKNGDCAKAVK